VLDANDYRFDELGWLQFEGLCTTLLDLGPARWETRDFGAAALVSVAADLPAGVGRLVTPTLVVSVWLRPGESRHLELGRILSDEHGHVPFARSMLVLTNVETSRATAGIPVPVVLLGPERLGALLDSDAALRMQVPSMLGIRDLAGLLNPEVVARSTFDVGGAVELARVFVPTSAYRATLEVLVRRRFAVITGPPEMGKTAIARMVALARMTDGWEAHECIRPEQLWASFDPERCQVFVADDAFGSTEYRPDAARRWALELPRILHGMDDRHCLIWTSRPAPLRAGLGHVRREHGLERFPRPEEVQVDAAALAIDEKALILFRHARAATPPPAAVELVRTHGWTIVSHPHFTPERIRRFVAERMLELASGDATDADVARAVAAEIREPTDAMATSFAALAPEHRMLLVALLDAPPGPVASRDLVAAFRRHSDTATNQDPAEMVDRLTDHFVRVVPPSSVGWVHPSWRDLVISQLADDPVARSRFLERGGLEGILLALSVGGGVSGERVLPLLRDDADWDTAAARIARLAPDLDGPSGIRLLDTLAAALDADLRQGDRAETIALTSLTLARLAAQWDVQRAMLSAGAIAAWFSLAGRLAEPPRAPGLDRTWVELLPAGPVDVDSHDEIVRFDDWLELVEVIRAFAPQELARLGFPLRHHDILALFVRSARSGPSEARDILTSSLARLTRVASGYAVDADEAARELHSDDRGWFDVELDALPPSRSARASDRTRVERVLRDL
jgi:hypothetical protein